MDNRNSHGKLLKRTTLSLDKETLQTLSMDTLEGVHGANAQTAPTVNLFGGCIAVPGDNILAARKKKPEAVPFWKQIRIAASLGASATVSGGISKDTFVDGTCKKITHGSDWGGC